jgi:hypothetical protein
MPLSHAIDASRRLVITRASGHLTEEDMRFAQAMLHGDPGFRPSYRQLIDLRGVDSVGVSVPAMARIAAASAFTPGVRRAFVGTSEEQYDVARVFATLSEPHNQIVHVFRELMIAEAWLMEGRAPD